MSEHTATMRLGETVCAICLVQPERGRIMPVLWPCASSRVAAAEAKISEMEAALEWYADERHYSAETTITIGSVDPHRHPPIVWDTTEIVADGGERARAALSGTSEAGASRKDDELNEQTMQERLERWACAESETIIRQWLMDGTIKNDGFKAAVAVQSLLAQLDILREQVIAPEIARQRDHGAAAEVERLIDSIGRIAERRMGICPLCDEHWNSHGMACPIRAALSAPQEAAARREQDLRAKLAMSERLAAFIRGLRERGEGTFEQVCQTMAIRSVLREFDDQWRAAPATEERHD